MIHYNMPSLGADMASGTLLEWLVKPGDRVKRGDIIAVVGTEKGDIEVEIFEEGTVDALLIPAGTEAPVGTPIAVIRGEGEPAGPPPLPAPARPVQPVQTKAEQPAPVATPAGKNGAARDTRIRISPVARKLAEELGVDLTGIVGTGPQGAISRADIEAAAARAQSRAAPVTPPPPAAPAPTEPVSPAPMPTPPSKPGPALADKSSADFQAGMRRAIALAMARANRDIPHYYLMTRIDMSRALRWLEAENLKRSIADRVLPAVLLVRAVALALTRVPELNGYWIDDRLQTSEAIHIGFAIALRQGGLVTPAIHNADMLSMDETMAALRDLIMRTRAGRLRSSELTDATITVTNLGDLGVESVFGVIYPPQVALVGFGKITEQPWAENGMLGIRPVLTATIAGDHRATDGRTGGQFLDHVTKLLSAPEKLWEPAS